MKSFEKVFAICGTCDIIHRVSGWTMNEGGTSMEPIYLSIQQKATGERIRELLKRHGYTVKDIQEIMGFENPQAVYKWLSGKSLPSIDNFLILSRVLHTNIEDILVIDGDIAFCVIKSVKRIGFLKACL